MHRFYTGYPDPREICLSFAGMENLRVAIVGAAGFVGQHLALALSKKSCILLLIDSADMQQISQAQIAKLNITDRDKMTSVLSGFTPDLVIHLASMGMSGSAMLSSLCKTVNVHATSNLIDICVELSIPNVIYTSSYNVAYGGKEIINGDETLPYFPIDQHTDQYSPTKALAEQLVLKANGRRLKSSGSLKTSCIRPAAIYGIDEKRHLPRIVKHIDTGLFQFRIGKAMVDWVDIDNLILAYELLIEKLIHCEDSNSIPAGQVYCISDGTPIENFEFLRPLCIARGKSYPSIVLPTDMMLSIAQVLEGIYHITRVLGCPIEPFLTRAEVYKVGISHYFSIHKAQNELNYKPIITSKVGGERIARRYHETLSNENYFDLPSQPWWVSILLGMGLLGIVAYSDPQSAVMHSVFMQPVNQLALLLFRSQENLQYLFIAAVLTHAAEASAAIWLAQVEGCRSTWWLWGIQTFILGYPSMQLLYRRRALLKSISEKNL